MAKKPPKIKNEEKDKKKITETPQQNASKEEDWDLENFNLDDGPEEDDY